VTGKLFWGPLAGGRLEIPQNAGGLTLVL